MANDEKNAAPEQLWQTGPAYPGEQTMIYRDSSTRELVGFSMNRQRRVFKVRAVVTDQGQPLNCSLEEVLAFQPRNRIRLPDGAFSLWKHYGGTRAVFHDFRADDTGSLWAVEVDVSAIKPEVALAYARAAVNQLLDSLTFPNPHPIVIQRLELLSPRDNQTVLAYQITMPSQFSTDLRKFPGVMPGGTFVGSEAILREAVTNSSPYYRLLLAFRGFEGTALIRQHFVEFVRRHNVQAEALAPTKLDPTEIAQHGFPQDVQALQQKDIFNFPAPTRTPMRKYGLVTLFETNG